MPDIISPTIQSIQSEIKRFDEIWELVNTGDLDGVYLDELEISLKDLSQASSDIHAPGGATRTNASKILEHVARADAAASLLDSSLNNLMNYSVASSSVVKNAKNWLTSTIIPWLSNLWKSVWATMQKITILKGWKISGDMGSQTFGLGGASIEISFG